MAPQTGFPGHLLQKGLEKQMFLYLETFLNFENIYLVRYFETRFLEEADKFIAGLDMKAVKKLIYNIDRAEQTNDPTLFKKLKKEIWEIRLRHAGLQIRLLAFWDKTNNQKTLVIATHGFIKKADKVPLQEIERAENIMKKYFENKTKK